MSLMRDLFIFALFYHVSYADLFCPLSHVLIWNSLNVITCIGVDRWIFIFRVTPNYSQFWEIQGVNRK